MKHILLASTLLFTPAMASADVFGLSGMKGVATETTQKMHVAINEVGNAARLAELTLSNENWALALMKMSGSEYGTLAHDIQSIINQSRSIRNSILNVIDDPSKSGAYLPHLQFRAKQIERSLGRIEEVMVTDGVIDERSAKAARTNSALIDRNMSVHGQTEASQVGNELTGVTNDYLQQLLIINRENLRESLERQARDTENQLLAQARHCNMNPDEC